MSLCPIGKILPYILATKSIAISLTHFSIAMDIRPNHTIYINNLNEKIKKDGKIFWGTF